MQVLRKKKKLFIFQRATLIKTAVSVTACAGFPQAYVWSGQDPLLTPRAHSVRGLSSSAALLRKILKEFSTSLCLSIHFYFSVMGFSSGLVIHCRMCLVMFDVIFITLVSNSSPWWAIHSVYGEPWGYDALWKLWHMHMLSHNDLGATVVHH